MNKKAVDIVVRGRVQGVGFRFFTRQQADPRGITGWVKNRADGSVEIHAEGDATVLEDFVDRIEQGPTFGHVDDANVNWTEPSGRYSSFEIIH